MQELETGKKVLPTSEQAADMLRKNNLIVDRNKLAKAPTMQTFDKLALKQKPKVKTNRMLGKGLNSQYLKKMMESIEIEMAENGIT